MSKAQDLRAAGAAVARYVTVRSTAPRRPGLLRPVGALDLRALDLPALATAALLVCASLATGCASTSSAGALGGPGTIDPGTTRKVVLAEKVLGFRRSYRLHRPAGVADGTPGPGGPRPLVVAVHGGMATAAIFERQSNFSAVADRHGFVVAYPNGIGIFSLLRHWNGGFCCAKAMRHGVDDVAFLDRVIDDVAGRVPIDPSRIYVVGYSNGGMLAYLYGARRSERIAGLAIFASSIGLEDGESTAWSPPAPARPFPVTIYHGVDDPRLPVSGRADRSDSGLRTIGPRASAGFWAEVNGCEAEPVESRRPGVETTTWCDGSAVAVRLQMLQGWDHSWPGPRTTDRLEAGSPLSGFDAADEIWGFFESSRRDLRAGGRDR